MSIEERDLISVGCGVEVSASEDRTLTEFVVSLAVGAEEFYMTVEDAAICILEWTAEGIELPYGLTPIRLSGIWNSIGLKKYSLRDEIDADNEEAIAAFNAILNS